MSDNPSTIQSEPGGHQGIGWNDSAELHKCEDGGGVFDRFKTIRRGTLAQLITFVVNLPDAQQNDYAIQKDGDHRFSIGEIRNLSRRADFPRSASDQA